jgi:cytochrome c
MIELLLDEGADVNAESPLLGTPLAIAALKDNAAAVVVLLAAGADQRPRSTDGRTPLHAAAIGGSPAIVQLLVDAGGDVNARTTDDQNYAPAHSAGLAGHFDIVLLLRALGSVGPPIESVTGLLSTADVAQGEEVFESNCSGGCHAIEENPAGHRAAPNLWGVIGRDKASVEEFRYSRALQRTGGTWTFAELNAFLASPTDYVPGTSMHVSIEDAADRASLMAFLRLQSDAPLPFPISPQ